MLMDQVYMHAVHQLIYHRQMWNRDAIGNKKRGIDSQPEAMEKAKKKKRETFPFPNMQITEWLDTKY